MFLNDVPSRKYYADIEVSVRYSFISIIFTAKAVLDTAENVEDLTMDELKELIELLEEMEITYKKEIEEVKNHYV